MKKKQAEALLRKYRNGTISKEERALLESWYLDYAGSAMVSGDASPENLEQNLEDIRVGLAPARPLYMRPFFRWGMWAAVLLLTMAAGYLAYLGQAPAPIAPPAITGIPPGEEKAVLMLANGEKIALESAEMGNVATEGTITIVKVKEGEIVYNGSVQQAAGVGFNTISTPRKGQYSVRLPDGTRVWLNAASSIRFPTVFDAESRVVEANGEVYFEVAKKSFNDRLVPFIVEAGGQVIQVLGTAFNVNSYADEASFRTTLVEGSIRVNVAGKALEGVVLEPGEEISITRRARGTRKVDYRVNKVDPRSAVAWKDGYFRFDNIGLPELMRQLSRWYDIEVYYEGPVKEFEFVGEIERKTDLAQVLKILEIGGVRFHMNGNKITIE